MTCCARHPCLCNIDLTSKNWRSLGLQLAPIMEAKDEAVQCHMEVRSSCMHALCQSWDMLCKASLLASLPAHN